MDNEMGDMITNISFITEYLTKSNSHLNDDDDR